jgi:hypothetical protein
VTFGVLSMKTPAPGDMPAAFAAIVERVNVAVLVALPRTAIPDARLASLWKTVESVSCSVLSAPVVALPRTAMPPPSPDGAPAANTAWLLSIRLLVIETDPRLMPMPPPRSALPLVTREWSISTVAPAPTRMLPPTPLVVPVATPSVMVRCENPKRCSAPTLNTRKPLTSAWIVVFVALAPTITRLLVICSSPIVITYWPEGTLIESSVLTPFAAALAIAVRIVHGSRFAGHSPLPSAVVVTLNVSARAEGAAPSVATIPARTKKARQRMPERH